MSPTLTTYEVHRSWYLKLPIPDARGTTAQQAQKSHSGPPGLWEVSGPHGWMLGRGSQSDKIIAPRQMKEGQICCKLHRDVVSALRSRPEIEKFEGRATELLKPGRGFKRQGPRIQSTNTENF
ncbi:hypothetical protein EV356DRAFT_510159 [Viridothelium virens]|uniref:Uncharacterized protein n=1 Tax=Viridothelium virens TaxID=1048519 RepID=A0A6A6GW23_VIRVR|nr:hypothetical protein EV356DRAFT_510159 [Viridothelium virens]